MPNTQDWINIVCESRNVPKVKKGMRCIVGDRAGRIVGGNTSGNFNVKFDDNGDIRNCHPYCDLQIHTESGGIYYDYEQGIT